MIDYDMKSGKHLMDYTKTLISITEKIEANTVKKRYPPCKKVVFPLAGNKLLLDSDAENNSLAAVKRFSECFKEKLLESNTFPFTDRAFIDYQPDEDPSAAQISLDVSCIEEIDLYDSKQNLVNKNIAILLNNEKNLTSVNDSENPGKEQIASENGKTYCDYNGGAEDCNFSADGKKMVKRGRGRPRVQFRKTHPCNVCHKVFSRKSHLTTHLRIHSDEKPFQCSLCSKRFRDNSVLTKHIRVHTRDKPYSCTICRKAFTQKGNMDRHYRRHTDEKPFVCSVCANSFTTKSHLQRHLRIHLDEKPFTCELCEKSFRQKSHLMRHVLVHSREKPYACNLCDKRFRQEQHVSRHKMTHIKGLITNILSKQYVSILLFR